MKKVPDGWKFGKLQDFIFLQRGFDLTKSEAREGNVPVISSSGISYFHSAAMVEPPGVVTGRKGSLGGVYFVDVPYWPHDTTLWVKDFKGNHPEYVKIFLESLKLERFDAATSVPTLNRNNVHALKVAFPPLTEQRKIAQILSTWDGAIAKMDQLIAALQQRKKGLMQRLLTGEVRFPGFDTEWKETKLEEIAIDFISGGTPSTKVERYWKGNIPWVSSSDFSELRLERINRFITEEAVQNSAAHVVKAGSVLIVTRVGVGKLAIAPCDIAFSQDTTALIPNSELAHAGFLLYALSWTIPNILKFNQGTSINGVTRKDLRQHLLFLPSLDEQEKIAAALKVSDREIDLHAEKLAALKQQKKGLMQCLLTGQVRVKV